jgi:hypothetical protein
MGHIPASLAHKNGKCKFHFCGLKPTRPPGFLALRLYNLQPSGFYYIYHQLQLLDVPYSAPEHVRVYPSVSVSGQTRTCVSVCICLWTNTYMCIRLYLSLDKQRLYIYLHVLKQIVIHNHCTAVNYE